MTLNAIAELAYRQLFPNPSDETAVEKEDFIETARVEYAYEMWKLAKQEKRDEGEFRIPSVLLSEAKIDVIDNKADISTLEALRSLPNDSWIQSIGGIDSECKYVRTNTNHAQLFEGDDSVGDDARTFLVIGNSIVFPNGVHKNPIPIVYANNGFEIDGNEVSVDEAIGGIIRQRLIEIYGGKIGAEDVTNNTNSKD